MNYIENERYFRNDNFYINFKYFYAEKNYVKKNNNNLIIDLSKITKNKNNIYILIVESYPNFKDKNLSNDLKKELIKDTNINIKHFKRNFSEKFTTIAAEEFVFCNKFDENFILQKLKNYIENKNCWLKYAKKKKIYIHSYKKDFFNRFERYQSYFDQLFFYEDLNLRKMKNCPWNDIGSCDYDIIDNLDKIIDLNHNNQILIFLTLNNHLGQIYKTYDKEMVNCKNNFILNINPDFCILFNNQLKFNNSVNNFIKQMKKDEILILMGDTPPMFKKNIRKYFNEETDIFIFEK